MLITSVWKLYAAAPLSILNQVSCTVDGGAVDRAGAHLPLSSVHPLVTHADRIDTPRSRIALLRKSASLLPLEATRGRPNATATIKRASVPPVPRAAITACVDCLVSHPARRRFMPWQQWHAIPRPSAATALAHMAPEPATALTLPNYPASPCRIMCCPFHLPLPHRRQ